MHTLVLSIGSNLGNRKEYMDSARQMIIDRIGTIHCVSQLYESAAWGYRSENNFYNQCLEVGTDLNAAEILKKILKIENELGREREGDLYQDRSIDIDILFYDKLVIDTKDLNIPHPRINERNFVLVPLAEILPDLLHPVLKMTVLDMLEQCPDKGSCLPLNPGA